MMNMTYLVTVEGNNFEVEFCESNLHNAKSRAIQVYREETKKSGNRYEFLDFMYDKNWNLVAKDSNGCVITLSA